MEVISNRRRCSPLPVSVALVAAFAFAVPSGAQNCYSRMQGFLPFTDYCSTNDNNNEYDTHPAFDAYFIPMNSDPQYLIATMSNDWGLYNVTNPLTPTLVDSGHIPWDWTKIGGEGTHGPYNNHLMYIATAGGNFSYGLGMLGTYGWDIFKINGSGSGFLGHGYQPVNALPYSYQGAALFTIGGVTWAAAQMLDQASINSGDNSIRIYQVGNGSPAFTEALTPANIGTGSAVVPIGHTFDNYPYSQVSLGMAGMRMYVMYNGNGKWFLIVRSATYSGGTLTIVDVTNPASPQPVAFSNDPTLATASIAVDANHMRLWAGDPSKAIVYGYTVDPDTGAIGPGPTVDWIAGGPSTGGVTVPSVAGDLLVCVGSGYVGYVSLAGTGTPTVLPDGGTEYSYPTRACGNPNPSYQGDHAKRPTVFVLGGNHYVARTRGWSHDIVAVSSGCISTVPVPNFNVTGGETAATCSAPAGTTQADAGFPGDAFTITDASAGAWTTATLDIQNAAGATIGGGFPMLITPGQAVPWTPPSSTAPADFYVVLSIAGGTPPSTTKVISLCNNPKATLTVTDAGAACANPAAGCTALVNDAIVLGAAAAGHPSAGATTYYQLGAGTPVVGSTFTAAQGTYTVGAVVPYSFVAANDTACTNALFGTVDTTVYHSCSVGTVTAGYGTASFQVEQPAGNKVADANTPGPVNIAQSVTLRFLGRIATGYAPTFTWSSIPLVAGVTPTCTYTGGAAFYTGSTCVIPANGLVAGAAAPWGLSVDVCAGASPGTGCGTPIDTQVALPVTVTPTANSFSFSASPTSVNVGDPITITLANVIGTYQYLTFDLGGAACDGSTQLVYSCITPFGNQCVTGTRLPAFRYGSSEKGKTDTITASGTLAGGGTVPSPTQAPITISSSNTTCPCPTVSTSVNGPTTALVGQQVDFTASATAGTYTITGYSWDYGDGHTDTGAFVSHAFTNAGSYTVRVTASSSCGNTGSATMVINVGGGGGGNLSITPVPSTAGIGQNVTFNFTPKITSQGDAINFNFGDGTSQTVIYSAICQISGGCGTVTHAYAAAGSFTMTGSGTAGGSSVSGSAIVSVIDNCTATTAPTAAFNWTPTQPQVNQPVQFMDMSAGSPTSWSWIFGAQAAANGLDAVTALAAGDTLTISYSPLAPAVGQKVTFTFSPALTTAGDTMTFTWGDGSSSAMSYNPSLCPPSGCASITHTYTSAQAFSVSGSGTAGGVSVSGSTTITVTGSSTGVLYITPTPAAPSVNQSVTFTFSPALTQNGDIVTFSFGDTTQQAISYPACGIACNVVTHAYSAAGGYVVGASGTAGGLQVAGGTQVSVSAGGGGGGTSTLQNPLFTYTTPGTYTVTLTATNCKGSSTLQKQITILPSCTLTVAPTASFTTGPTGALPGFPEQQQPYAGQQVTLTDTSTNSPISWQWCDFEELGPACSGTPRTGQSVTATWTAAGQKHVRLTACNCFGCSTQALQMVTINPDVRHVVADFTWTPDTINTGTPITFTAATGAANGDPDTFVWKSDDVQGTAGGSSVTHTFTCAGPHRVTLTSSRSNYAGATATVTKLVYVNGTLCGPQSVMTVDNAKVNGLNGTSWRTDVRIFNPSSSPTTVTLEFLPVNQDNTHPNATFVPPAIASKGTLVLNDIIGWISQQLGSSFTKAALRVTYENGDNVAPMVIGRTYTPSQGGGTYGQFTPGIGVYPGTSESPMWLTGLRNNGLDTGFRTNYSFVNLLGDNYVGNINVTLYDETGTPKKTVTLGLGPFGYVQDSIKNLFGTGYDTVGTFSLKVDLPPGADIQAFASVVDNQTGAPVLIPAAPPADSPIYLPAVAHTNGKNGTVWRSDMQLTNPDTVPHTWTVTYTPKASDNLSVQQRQIVISPQKSILMADALDWVFSGILPDTTNTSGVLKITPGDGGSVYPVVQARSFNQTAAGTFGQNITPFTADMGVSTQSTNSRLLLTGMSTADIARTNFGFVNLSENSSVNFAVIFYDESGNVLNPKGNDNNPIPYTFALGVGGWDQDQLENRFRNAFGSELPANLRAISAEVTVTGGGPGTVYATVIDNLTGDPVFVPGQQAP